MNTKLSLFFLYSITLIVISFILYLALYKPTKVSQKRSEIPHASFETHHWGYSWRPWWRKYGGIPGFNPEEGNPLPKPQMPVPPKPIIVNTKPILY